MAKKRIELTLTLEIETGDADIIDVVIASASSSRPAAKSSANGVPEVVERMIEEFASPSISPMQTKFAERCVADLELDLRPPSGGRKYVNAYPPKRFGAKRAAAFDVKTGRVEIYCSPSNAKGRKHAKVVFNNKEPFAVKVYLHSEAAVDEAIALTRLGLDERGS